MIVKKGNKIKLRKINYNAEFHVHDHQVELYPHVRNMFRQVDSKSPEDQVCE